MPEFTTVTSATVAGTEPGLPWVDRAEMADFSDLLTCACPDCLRSLTPNYRRHETRRQARAHGLVMVPMPDAGIYWRENTLTWWASPTRDVEQYAEAVRHFYAHAPATLLSTTQAGLRRVAPPAPLPAWLFGEEDEPVLVLAASKGRLHAARDTHAKTSRALCDVTLTVTIDRKPTGGPTLIAEEWPDCCRCRRLLERFSEKVAVQA